MSGNWWRTGGFSIFSGLAVLIVMGAPLYAADGTASTPVDRTALEMTLYNDGTGLVKESRRVYLPSGEGDLNVSGVADLLMPETVKAGSISHPSEFKILEQSCESDLITPARLLEKYVGKKITIEEMKGIGGGREAVEAEVVSVRGGEVYRINGKIYLGHPGMKVLPAVPEGMLASPQLLWRYENLAEGEHEIDFSYMTRGIGWTADYALVLDEDESSIDISGWVTIDNHSGADYENTSLRLVAGDLNRVGRKPEMAAGMAGDVPAQGFRESGIFEYHVYDMERKTTIRNMEKKQIKLLEATGAAVKKEFLVYDEKSFFYSRYLGRRIRQPVWVYVKFDNTAENGLGMPFPAGVMRIYRKDGAGGRLFVGEERIQHTSEGEDVTLRAGKAFDITVERAQVDYRRVTSTLHESEWEVSVRNRKNVEVSVGIVDPVPEGWEILEASHQYRREDAFSIRFDVVIPPAGEIKLKYRIKAGL